MKQLIDMNHIEETFRNSGTELTSEERDELATMDRLVNKWTAKLHCGDVNGLTGEGECETCEVGVAHGLTFLDLAFNAGHRMARYDPEIIWNTYEGIVDGDLIEDRREYSVPMLAKMYLLNEQEAEELKALINFHFEDHGGVDLQDVKYKDLLHEYIAETIHNGFDGWDERSKIIWCKILNDMKLYFSDENRRKAEKDLLECPKCHSRNTSYDQQGNMCERCKTRF